ncbi:MAG: heme-binding protein [Planctomycetota bacterium]
MFGALIAAIVAVAGGPNAPTAETPVVHVSGEHPEITSREKKGETLYACGDVFTEAKLPEGYPRPTPPGVVELKYYPGIRRAEFSSDAPAGNMGRVGFMPLFRHISSRDIAMTAPVEMDKREDGWTMSFLYEKTEDGPLEDDGRVKVVDTQPVIVLSLGVQGANGFDEILPKADELTAWIDENDAWEQAGDIRTMGYNGPYIPRNRKWWEIQVPVRQVEAADDAAQNVPEAAAGDASEEI